MLYMRLYTRLYAAFYPPWGLLDIDMQKLIFSGLPEAIHVETH